MGKTRLVKEIIKRKSEDAECKETIAFVSFEYVTNAAEEEVLDTLVSRLKLAPANAEDRLPALVRQLSATPVLLVLDNCETARTSIAKVVNPLLGRCRNLKILASSQHQLGCHSETVYRLPPLSVPDNSPVSLADLEHLESYELFLTRVQMVDDKWIPEKNSASSVRQLLQLTEGIPLAIEIVAAWAPVLSLSQICNELAEKPLGSLMERDGYSIDDSGRHQSMLRCFEWSLDHLLPNEAAVFKRLGVFAGQFTLEAVDAVCEVDQPRKLLMHLVKKSLVHVCPGTESHRYKLLNFTRAFARQKAKAEGLDEQLSRHHLDYCLSLIQPSADEDSREDEVVVSWEEDWPDLLAAANAAPSIGDLQAVWRISRALGPFLQQRGLWSEREQLNRASVKAAAEAHYWAALERSLVDLGIVLEAQGRWEDAAAQYRQCLYYANRNATRNLAHQASALEHLGVVLTRLGDHAGVKRAQGKLEEIMRSLEPRSKARSLDIQGRLFQDQGELVKACAKFRDALVIREGIGDTEGLARSRMNLGTVLTLQMDCQAAEDELRMSLDYWTSHNSAREQAIVTHLLADLFRRQRRLPEALDFCDKSLEIRKDDRKGMAVTKTLLAKVLVAKGDYQPAIDALQESCKLSHLLGDMEGESIAFDQIGAINTLQQRWDKALDAFGKSRQLKESAGRCDIIGLGITWDRIAQVHARRGKWVLAQEAYTRSLAYSRKAGRKVAAAVTLINVAMMHAAQGQKETALKVLNDAIASLESEHAGKMLLRKVGKLSLRLDRKMREGTPWKHWQDAAFENQSLFIRMRFDSERKNKRWKEAAAGYESLAGAYTESGQQMEAGLALNELGGVYRHLNDPVRSESAIRKALAIFEEIALPLGLAGSWHKLGDLFAEQHRCPEAEDAYNKSINLKQNCLDDEGEAISQGVLAELLIKVGRLPEAELAANRAWEVLSEIGTVRQKWYPLVCLLRIKVEQGDPTGAQGIAARLAEAVRGNRELEAAAGELRAMAEAGNWDGVKAHFACAGNAGPSEQPASLHLSLRE